MNSILQQTEFWLVSKKLLKVRWYASIDRFLIRNGRQRIRFVNPIGEHFRKYQEKVWEIHQGITRTYIIHHIMLTNKSLINIASGLRVKFYFK